MMKTTLFSRLLAGLLVLVASVALANESVKLDRAPIDPSDNASMQRGAQHFVNYCLSCHGAQLVRFNTLQRIGLSDEQIKNNLILTGAKPGDYMSVTLAAKDAKKWFGVPPPDLSVEARVRGADWLYSYLRSFYRDDSRDSGWNNRVFPQVAMPHVLVQLQGEQVLKGEGHETRLELVRPGKMSPQEYDQFVTDLVNFMGFIAEPAHQRRINTGFGVLAFLAFCFVIAYALKREFWKDIH
jgi:ubiquinol-cytochrome c reductase cytochrome c1 subunit